MKKYFESFGHDLSSSIVVLLVALPLCLGIALASGAPLFSGIIAGIVGGIVVGILSGSHLSVSGPAAGLTVIVSAAIIKLGAFDIFLLAVVLAGCIQILLGMIKAGFLGDFVPNSVIKGMLAAIGIILILKQFPHLIGYDISAMGEETFEDGNKENTFTGIYHAFLSLNMSALTIGITSMLILMGWENKFIKKIPVIHLIPGPLLVVIAGVLINQTFFKLDEGIALTEKHLVNLPISEGLASFGSLLTFPRFEAIVNQDVWIAAVTLAIVASLETLLGIEAVDKLDPYKRVTPTNRELNAQGVGNIISGLVGGLPLTSVIVRSSANVNSGAKTKLSAILHGVLMFFCVLYLPEYLNKIPLASLAAILIFTGYKLAKWSLIREYYQKGWDQFVPFIVTIIAILLTDLLKGIAIGILIGLFYMVRSNFRSAILIIEDNNRFLFRFKKDVSFLNKSFLKRKLEMLPHGAHILVDASKADFIDRDIIEVINEFSMHASLKEINIEVKFNDYNPQHQLFQSINKQ